MTRDDQVRSMLDMARKRAESAPGEKSLDVAEWPRIHRHYTDVDTCEHGERLNVGWLELGMEAENAQQLLDFIGIPDGHPQGRGDVDWRVAEAVLRLMDTNGRLSAIASAHARETAPGGMVGDFCIECDRRWPCPTYLWADGQRDTLDCWDPADERVANRRLDARTGNGNSTERPVRSGAVVSVLPVQCPGHFPACTHRDGFMACRDCIDERDRTGPLYCADLDNCGGPGCMDRPLTAPNKRSVRPVTGGSGVETPAPTPGSTPSQPSEERHDS